MKAIDLYSGVGGWSLGMRMAGIDVVASYEWWSPANETNKINNGHATNEVDIRALDLKALPQGVDIVVGSPPCTQFSFANRGGQGDIEDGLKDIIKFFEVVAHVKPRYWAMENVPRVEGILREEFAPGGRLHRFAKKLDPFTIAVVNMEEFGVPQRRARCIAGNFDFDLLFSYRERCPERTLGDVIAALSAPTPWDPIYGKRSLPLGLVDHTLEEPLDAEEARMNREAKTHHPVYNNMPFPDPIDRPVRTITALCTRVSRESVVVADERTPGNLRRLTVRERASLQGFPIDFQFYGSSYPTKMKLIGNAVPPLMTFYIGQAMRGVDGAELIQPSDAISVFSSPTTAPPVTVPEKTERRYNTDRRFRAAIPGLRFKSGMRFELANDCVDGAVSWTVAFYFGNSKSVRHLSLDKSLVQLVRRSQKLDALWKAIQAELDDLETAFEQVDPNAMQIAWSRRGDGVHPYAAIDRIADSAVRLRELLDRLGPLHSVLEKLFEATEDLPGWKKLAQNANAVIAGVLVGATVNETFTRPKYRKAA
jgi:DNA (cytosine-5)-methyltransferase 1